MFVYKDFVIRELLQQLLLLKDTFNFNFVFLDKLEAEYSKFIHNDFV
jgi:hypothetical protein